VCWPGSRACAAWAVNPSGGGRGGSSVTCRSSACSKVTREGTLSCFALDCQPLRAVDGSYLSGRRSSFRAGPTRMLVPAPGPPLQAFLSIFIHYCPDLPSAVAKNSRAPGAVESLMLPHNDAFWPARCTNCAWAHQMEGKACHSKTGSTGACHASASHTTKRLHRTRSEWDGMHLPRDAPVTCGGHPGMRRRVLASTVTPPPPSALLQNGRRLENKPGMHDNPSSCTPVR